MVKVGIIIASSKSWMGRTNYLKNLICAVSALNDRKIKFVLFFGENAEKDIVTSFEGNGTIVRTSLLDRTNILGLINAFFIKFFGSCLMLNNYFVKYQIDVVSHSGIYTKRSKHKTINWIADFQHRHLPWMFSFVDITYRDYQSKSYAKYSDAVVLSSYDARNYFNRAYPKYKGKVHVLQFVSQPDKKIYEISNTRNIEGKYGFSGKYFYLPNQLWKHKNHMIVIKALALLKKKGREVLVISTGHMGDYRHKDYFEQIMICVKEDSLENNIKFLGLIEYLDVMTLMRHCVSIINPSLFEGWSSTVEEAKSVGKNMILSNISVHKEQNPPQSIYFDPHDENDLADKLWNKWQESHGGPDFDLEEIARKNIEARTKDFGNAYQKIVLDVSQRSTQRGSL
jgi:glycosyltransferase involved in cell wall biosynthesis